MTRHYVLAGVPPLVMTAALALLAGAELVGSHPLTSGAPRTAPEAIVMRDHASAARLLESGANADEIALVRAGIISDRPLLLTAAEAAVIVDAAPMLEYLVSRGARVQMDLACLARDVGARTVQRHLPDAGECVQGAQWTAVVSRP